MLSNIEAKLSILKQISREAGKILLSYYDSPTGVETKLDNTLVSDADKASSTFITKELMKHFPKIPIVDEEGISKGYDNNSKYCWIIDPLDGTKEFLAQRQDFGILIGLVENGIPVLGITFRPLANELDWAIKDKGAFIEDAQGTRKISILDSNEITVLVSGSRSDQELEDILRILSPKKITEKHSAFKIIDVAKGQASLYICSRKNTMHIWDTCAPSIILQEAGGKTTDLYGKPLDYSFKSDNHEKGIVCSNNYIHQNVINKISKTLA